MIIEIATERTDIAEGDDCRRLHAVADGLDDEAAGAALAAQGLGRAGEPGHIWFDVAALRRCARAAAATSDWEDRFDSMLTLAAAQGWLDDVGGYVSAHIERGGTGG
jgi:hypothetical protein